MSDWTEAIQRRIEEERSKGWVAGKQSRPPTEDERTPQSAEDIDRRDQGLRQPLTPFDPHGGRGGTSRTFGDWEPMSQQQETYAFAQAALPYVQMPEWRNTETNEWGSPYHLASQYRFGDPERVDAVMGGSIGDIDSAALYMDQVIHEMDGKTLGEMWETINRWEYSDPDRLAKFQAEMLDAGYYLGDEPLVMGRLDPNTQQAMSMLLNDVSAKPGRTIGELLTRFSGQGELWNPGRGGRGGGGGGGPVFAYGATTADTLSLLVDQVSQGLIGRRVDDAEKDAIIANLQGVEKAQAEQQFNARQAGGSFEAEPLDVTAQSEIIERYGDEYAAVQYSNQIDVIRSILGGL